MAHKIAYILGAGASIGAFPLVKKTKSWGDRDLADVLKQEGESLMQRFTGKPEDATSKEIADALKETGVKSKEFGNVDTYAKYLYHTKQDEKLKQLKIALTFYFIGKQTCFSKSIEEKRYINFFTALVNDQHKFPEHVKVLNWNYDYLLEMASLMFGEEKVEETQTGLYYSPPLIGYSPHPDFAVVWKKNKIPNDRYSLVHLNGIAGIYLSESESKAKIFRSMFNDIQKLGKKGKFDVGDLIKLFHEKYINNSHLITFAWEKDSLAKNILDTNYKITEEIIKGTTILVVIGYSFPFYNREVDKMIFETIQPTLAKIYFQDPNNDGMFLSERYGFKVPRQSGWRDSGGINGGQRFYVEGIDIKHIKDVDQFYVPIEL